MIEPSIPTQLGDMITCFSLWIVQRAWGEWGSGELLHPQDLKWDLMGSYGISWDL